MAWPICFLVGRCSIPCFKGRDANTRWSLPCTETLWKPKGESKARWPSLSNPVAHMEAVRIFCVFVSCCSPFVFNPTAFYSHTASVASDVQSVQLLNNTRFILRFAEILQPAACLLLLPLLAAVLWSCHPNCKCMNPGSIYMYTHAYIYIYTHVHTHTYIYIYMCVCVYVCIYTYMSKCSLACSAMRKVKTGISIPTA